MKELPTYMKVIDKVIDGVMKHPALAIIVLDAINGILFGVSFRFQIGWLSIGTVVFALFLAVALSNTLQKGEAKRRTITNPITSVDQLGSMWASLFIVTIVFILFAGLTFLI